MITEQSLLYGACWNGASVVESGRRGHRGRALRRGGEWREKKWEGGRGGGGGGGGGGEGGGLQVQNDPEEEEATAGAFHHQGIKESRVAVLVVSEISSCSTEASDWNFTPPICLV